MKLQNTGDGAVQRGSGRARFGASAVRGERGSPIAG